MWRLIIVAQNLLVLLDGQYNEKKILLIKSEKLIIKLRFDF